MPKYLFECQVCNVRFERTLKIGDHPTQTCPSCKDPAPRVWDGQGFGFGFAEGTGSQAGNSGVTKDDYPTADHAVGKSADARWAEINEREKVKRKVREVGGTTALVRNHAPDRSYIEYSSMTPEQIEGRRKLAADAQKATEAAKGD